MDVLQLAQHLQKALRDRREHVMEVLELSGLTSMEHYRYLMGELASLNYTAQALNDFLEKRELVDD